MSFVQTLINLLLYRFEDSVRLNQRPNMPMMRQIPRLVAFKEPVQRHNRPCDDSCHADRLNNPCGTKLALAYGQCNSLGILPTVENLLTSLSCFYNEVMANDGFLPAPESGHTFCLSAAPQRSDPQSQESTPELNKWRQAMQDPAHSQRYVQRWERLEAEGNDINGEARAIDAMASRRAAILDAGCGNGRLAGYLAAAGHDVIGIDLDPHLVELLSKYSQPTLR